MVSTGSWRRISELLNHFNVPYTEKSQNIENKMVEKNIIVFVIGGITYAEVCTDSLSFPEKQFSWESIFSLGLLPAKFGTAFRCRDYYWFDGNDQH